jgi:hypothetical protein
VNVIRTQLLFAHDGVLGLVVAPVLVVATRGQVGDWAAYAAGIPLEFSREHEPESGIAELVAEHGFKLSESQARAFFPNVDGDYRP